MNERATVLHEFLESAASAHPEKPAIIYRDRMITYHQLHEMTTRLANSLIELGIKKGNRVGIFLPRIPELVISYLALSKCGGIGFPISHESPEEEIRRVLVETEPSAIIVHASFAKFIEGVNQGIRIIGVGGEEVYQFSFRELLRKGKKDAPGIKVNPGDIFYLNFTSGTTGNPKAAITTHRNLFYNTVSAIEALSLKADDVHMCMFAVYSHPHEIFSRAIFLGGTIVLLDNIYPKSIAQEIQRNRVTCMMALPPFYEMILELDNIESFDLSSLRIAESGGMHTHETLKKRFVDRVGRRITSVWGSTETTGVAIANKFGMPFRENSVGTPCKYYEVRVLGETGMELPRGEVGELVFRGPGVISRYYEKELYAGDLETSGCYLSGDFGKQDEKGYFFFLGRKHGMLKVGGWKVYPLEVEVVLSHHPGVKEVAVTGASDSKRGEVPRAVIVPQDGSVLRKEHIIRFCGDKLARYKIPRVVDFVSELPKLPSGKVNRDAL